LNCKRKIFLFLIFTVFFLAEAGWSDSAIQYFSKGQKAQLKGNLDSAIELYRSALAINPNYYEPIKGLAESFFLLNEYDEALRYVEVAEKYRKNDTDLMNLKGRILIGLGKLDRARTIFNEILSIRPNDRDARYGLAELDLAEGKKRAAAEKYLETLRVAPKSSRALLSLALIYRDMGEADLSRKYLQLALKYNSGDAKVHLTAAEYLYAEKKYESALQHVNVAVSLNPQYEDGYLLKAEVLLSMKNYSRAAEAAKQVIEIDKRNSIGWYLLGISLMRLDEVDKAANSFLTALRLAPDDEATRITLENMAIEKIDQKDDLRKRLSSYHFERGKLFEEKNYLARAKREYRRALLLEPTSKDARLAFAHIYKILGYPIKYLKELEIITKLKIKDTLVKDEIENYRSIEEESLSHSWGVDQYGIERKKFTFGTYLISKDIDHPIKSHRFFDNDYLEYFNRGFERFDNVEISDRGVVENFNEAFKRARKNNTDYFLLVKYLEGERDFFTSIDVFLTRTGTRLMGLNEYRTGNDRIRDAVMRLTEKMKEKLPLHGTIIKKTFDRALIDLGKWDGVKKGDTLIIIKKNRLGLAGDSISFTFDKGDILGRLKVLSIDERVSEGQIIRNSFFDLINTGDEVIYAPVKKENNKETKLENRGLLKRILGL